MAMTKSIATTQAARMASLGLLTTSNTSVLTPAFGVGGKTAWMLMETAFTTKTVAAI
jgi:hypothetical protein